MKTNIDNTRFYEKKKRERVDNCNICGVKKELTYDHIPPKCCFNSFLAKSVEPFSLEITKDYRCSQNGIKYRSICAECNNGLLGKYDKELECFVLKIQEILVKNGETEEVVLIKTKINSLARAVCGHILAMKEQYYAPAIIDQAIREYILDTTAMPPKFLKLLMWYYPYSTVLIMQDFAIAPIAKKLSIPDDGVVSVLSSFPIAFLIKDGEKDCGLVNLFDYCTANFYDEVEIPLDFNSRFFAQTKILRDARWPCNISDGDHGTSALICSKGTMSNSVFAVRNSEELRKKLYYKSEHM